MWGYTVDASVGAIMQKGFVEGFSSVFTSYDFGILAGIGVVTFIGVIGFILWCYGIWFINALINDCRIIHKASRDNAKGKKTHKDYHEI